jgi:hypothetical protein
MVHEEAKELYRACFPSDDQTETGVFVFSMARSIGDMPGQVGSPLDIAIDLSHT